MRSELLQWNAQLDNSEANRERKTETDTADSLSPLDILVPLHEKTTEIVFPVFLLMSPLYFVQHFDLFVIKTTMIWMHQYVS